jgi:hypothetical protein
MRFRLLVLVLVALGVVQGCHRRKGPYLRPVPAYTR